jgi:hypothetical protein
VAAQLCADQHQEGVVGGWVGGQWRSCQQAQLCKSIKRCGCAGEGFDRGGVAAASAGTAFHKHTRVWGGRVK